MKITTCIGIGIESARIKFTFFKKHNAKLLLCFPLDLIHLMLTGVRGEGRYASVTGDLARLSLVENSAKSILFPHLLDGERTTYFVGQKML